MIKSLSKFYNDSGELVVSYDPGQEVLYQQAHKELLETAESKGLKHHSPELRKARDEIQKKYQKKGLQLDLFSLPMGIHEKDKGNFCAMALKHFLKAEGFQVLVSEEDYYLMLERKKNRYKNDGYEMIKKIFGSQKISELLDNTKNGGDPDVFAFLDHDPTMSWFIEAKRPTEGFTRPQKQNFPYIRDLLCPVETARMVRLSGGTQETVAHVPKKKNIKQNRKSIRYRIVTYDEYYERPTAFKHYLRKYRQTENIVVEALSQEAMDYMIKWLKSSKNNMEGLSGKLKIPLPRTVRIQFEDEIIEVNLNPERNVD